MTPLLHRPGVHLVLNVSLIIFSVFIGVCSTAQRCKADEETGQQQAPAIVTVTESVIAEDAPRPQFSLGPVERSSSVLDDARLNDVCRVGQFCWAVGDHGVITASSDAGATWETRCLATDCRLTSVSFLTDKVGWIAGVRFVRGVDRPSPVLLSTRDGGVTWKNLVESPEMPLSSVSALPVTRIPGFRQIRFFGLHDALAVCFPIAERTNATVVRTKDGGFTWEPIRREGQSQPSVDDADPTTQDAIMVQNEPLFEAACFLSEAEAIVGGPGLSYGTIVGEQLVPVGLPTATLRSARGISADSDGLAWIVGDGGFVLRSENGGISWVRNKPLVNSDVDRLLDFSTVVQNGSHVLIAGSPASVIFRSEDSGQTWTAVRTGMHGTVSRLMFVNAETVLGVGDFGAIIRSSDSGRTWEVVRSAGYRAGVMSLVTTAERQPWDVLASVSADEGIRSVSLQLSSEQTPGGSERRMIAGEAAQEIISGLGGNAFMSDWMFARVKTEQHRSQSQLIQEWNRQSDGRLQSLLPTRLAAWLRTWRPTVIVIEPHDDEDAVAGILSQVMDSAIRLAAGPAAGSAASSAAGDDHPVLASLKLEPWQVRRVVRRAPRGQTTAVRFRSTDLLENCGTTSGMMVNGATEPLVWLRTPALPAMSDNCYELIAASDEVTPAGLLAGLEQELRSDAKRILRKRGGEEVQQLKATAQRAHLESAAAVGQLERATTENAIIAQLQSMAEGLPETFALQQLKGLGETTRKRGDLDGYIAVQQEVVRRFPGTSDALLAAEELFVAYSSSEVRKVRVDRMQRRHPLAGRLPGVSPIGQAQIASGDGIAGESPVGEGLQFAPKVEAASGVQFSSAATDQGSSILSRWDQQAAIALEAIGNGDAAQMSSRTGLRHAANLRLAGKLGEQSSVISVLTQRDDAWQIMAKAELQSVHSSVASPVPVLNIQKSPDRPLLDAELTDACWEEAVEIPLTDSAAGADGTGFLLMTWDDQFLYIAGRMNHLPAGPNPEPRALNRKHDAQHGVRDRVEFSFDVDRDYSTSFDFRIDQTGQTSEDCWGIRNWDPQWFVATNTDDQSWRFEVAIPFQSLALANIRAGEMWAVRFRRVVPAYTTQVLSGSNAADSSGEGLGLVRFIRRQRK